ncbi:Uu.00g028070.m01.CDS01 [Anthostomella pinea]|uniref:Uu.00g028070.m01.CDS01 n=1 Tax=Anthostomella pinea TaxID=933095 RepID=A0AAI8V7T9_9PEZI|nr:Uu.00g028070.m01.CDS01 [Anthostomella pinea]
MDTTTEGDAMVHEQQAPEALNLLHDLPPELVGAIATYTDLDDLYTLRLVSKEIAARTQHVLCMHAFTRIDVMMYDRASLAKAVNFAEHPVLRNAMLHNEDNGDFSRDARMERRRRKKLYGSWLAEQDILIASGYHEASLFRILRSLREAGSKAEIIISDISHPETDVKDIPAHDTHPRVKEPGDTPFLTAEWSDHSRLITIIDAIKNADYHVKTLRVRGVWYGLPFYLFSSADGFPKIRHNLEGLERLELNLQFQADEAHRATEKEDIDNFLSFLDEFGPRLKHVDLKDVFGRDVFGSEDWAMAFPEPGEGTWEKCFARMLDETFLPITWFAKHKATLQQTKLGILHITGEEVYEVSQYGSDEWDAKVRRDMTAAGLPAPRRCHHIYPFR